MTSTHLFIESKKLAQAVDESAKQLKVKSGASQQTVAVNAESDALLISFHTHVLIT